MNVRSSLGLMLAAVALACFVSNASAVTINEIRIDQPSTDNDEYLELAGVPNESLDGLTYLVIGDGAAGSGVIENVTDLAGLSIPADGYFLAAEDTFTIGPTPDLTTALGFENSDNVTHLLVSNFTGALDDDLDTDDDGTLDTTPWDTIMDSAALIESIGSGDQVYSSTIIGPDGTFVPGHVFRYPNGTGAFQIGGFAGFPYDTPGVANVPEPAAWMILCLLASGAVALRSRLG